MPTIFDRFSMHGKTALVTGGAGLLGREFCRTLAEAGAVVYIAEITSALAEPVADELSRAGYQARAVGMNITKPEEIRQVVEAIAADTGRLDAVVNSAALDPKFDPTHDFAGNNAFEDYPLQSWQEAVDVNLTGAFLVSQACARQMVKQGKGSIINICSMYGLVGPDQRIYEKPGQPPTFKPVYYPVTKAGILGLTRYIATYYAGTQIRANALTPGGVFNQNDETFLKHYSARAVMGRMANKDEMNGAILFLASDASSYMTGANLVVDGGWTAW
jgi:2-deoxy-D-gluconate 3-dehydrogenase